MRNIIVSNCMIKGYHEFQIRPPQCVLLPVTKEYGNKHDPNACIIWVPELDKIPTNLWNETTDEKRGERVRTIAGLPIGRVPRGLSACFGDLLSMADVECIEFWDSCKVSKHHEKPF